MDDWTVVMDDYLCARVRVCALCGEVARWLDIRTVGGRSVLGGLCNRCHTQRGWHAVDQLLKAQRP